MSVVKALNAVDMTESFRLKGHINTLDLSCFKLIMSPVNKTV